jgi:hypothetical protein
MHRFATGGTIIATLMEIVTIGQWRTSRHVRSQATLVDIDLFPLRARHADSAWRHPKTASHAQLTRK